MLLGELSDLRETQSGKGLIRIGKGEGRTEGKRESLLCVLEAKFGSLPDAVRQKVQNVESDEKLTALLAEAVKVDSLDELTF